MYTDDGEDVWGILGNAAYVKRRVHKIKTIKCPIDESAVQWGWEWEWWHQRLVSLFLFCCFLLLLITHPCPVFVGSSLVCWWWWWWWRCTYLCVPVPRGEAGTPRGAVVLRWPPSYRHTRGQEEGGGVRHSETTNHRCMLTAACTYTHAWCGERKLNRIAFSPSTCLPKCNHTKQNKTKGGMG